jgi:uncharacterized protein (TIGR00106 family)
MGKIIAEVSIVPLGTKSTSLSHYVAEIEKIARNTPQVETMLTPMSTILEGELTDVLDLIQKMHETPFIAGAKRVSTRIIIDDRRDKTASMTAKMQSVEKKL